MLIAPKQLKIQTSNLASMPPSKSWHHDMTNKNISEREHGRGHVTATTVPCKLQQWDRYRVPQNVFLFPAKFENLHYGLWQLRTAITQAFLKIEARAPKRGLSGSGNLTA